MKFFIRFIKDLKKTGAIAPSSKFLARDLVAQLQADVARNNCAPLNILELGPGTGPLTKEICELVRPQDRFDIVEIQKPFYDIVHKKFSSSNIHVHYSDILNFQADCQYDYIFSSLPYENMKPSISRQIWEKKLSLCGTQSYICYFKYVNFRDFKSDFEEKVVSAYSYSKKIVFRNIPPAKLYTLQVNQPVQPQQAQPMLHSA